MMTGFSRSPELAAVSLRETALFLDFDGTLAPLQDDPDSVALPSGGRDTLLTLKPLLSDALVLISGRDVRDLSQRTPIEVWRAGGHGLEICAPGEAPSVDQAKIDPTILENVEAITAQHDGVRIEEKGPVLAIHYRQNPEAGEGLVSRMMAIVDTLPEYKVQHGKMVIELKPVQANKGKALTSMMQLPAFNGKTPIMVGDDTTDEDAMQAAQEFGGFGIKVGVGDTCSKYRLNDPGAVWDWLRRLVDEHA